MRFRHTLHINSKEIEIIYEALRMYRSHIDTCYEKEKFGSFGKDRFTSYRNKVISMTQTMEAIKMSEKPVVSEATIHRNDLS
jgi:hypothetical protein